MTETVAIIGAGLAGAICAEAFATAGSAVTVFEKSGGTGGRLSTRRCEAGAFDHGAQYLTAKGDGMRALLTVLAEKGAVARWTPDGKDRPGDWYVGTPGMSGLVKPLLAGIDTRLRTRVVSITLEPVDSVRVTTDDGAEHRFDRVIVTAPTPQAHALVAATHERFDALRAVAYSPCWAAMIAFDEPVPALPDVARGDDDSALAFLARNGSKPGRGGETFIVHAGGTWSARHLEWSAEAVLPILLDVLADHAGSRLAPKHAAAHRWRYARVDRPLGAPFLESACGRLAICGDGMLGGRAEAAADSAFALAAHTLGQGRHVIVAQP